VQKGVLSSGSKIYNHLPLNIKMLSKDAKRFKSTLRTYLTEHAFYSLDEYYQITTQWSWFFLHFLLLLHFRLFFLRNYAIVFWFMHVLSLSFYLTYLYKLYCCITVLLLYDKCLAYLCWLCDKFHICKDLRKVNKYDDMIWYMIWHDMILHSRPVRPKHMPAFIILWLTGVCRLIKVC
jgi:hypothetical protein